MAESEGIVSVLNAAGAAHVAGFKNVRGELRALQHGSRGLAASGGTNPAQVGFGADGDV